YYHAALRQGGVEVGILQAIAQIPGTAMQFDDEWEGTLAAGHEEPRQQGRIPVAEIFDVFYRDVIYLRCIGCHDMPSLQDSLNIRVTSSGFTYQTWAVVVIPQKWPACGAFSPPPSPPASLFLNRHTPSALFTSRSR